MDRQTNVRQTDRQTDKRTDSKKHVILMPLDSYVDGFSYSYFGFTARVNNVKFYLKWNINHLKIFLTS